MHADQLHALARATVEGSMPFPEIVGKLVAAGVEYYHVDYATRTFTFYAATGAAVAAPLQIEALPAIADDFDAAALKAAIRDSQQHGQKFTVFCQRATQAGVQGYLAFLRGQRVMYLGRQGDQLVEWFPGARPTDA